MCHGWIHLRPLRLGHGEVVCDVIGDLEKHHWQLAHYQHRCDLRRCDLYGEPIQVSLPSRRHLHHCLSLGRNFDPNLSGCDLLAEHAPGDVLFGRYLSDLDPLRLDPRRCDQRQIVLAFFDVVHQKRRLVRTALRFHSPKNLSPQE
jgi:hypothetical protein